VPTPRVRTLIPIFAGLLSGAATVPAVAGSIVASVRSDGEAVANAVVHAQPLDGSTLPRPAEPTAVMDQRDRAFVPHVLPVLRGASVRFPNSDETRHHVYSFSPAKTFELRLYKGSDADPVVFDRPGVVTVGCNIHDWMLGYILVLETPAFERTGNEGRARLSDLPDGRYRVALWHPLLQSGEAPARTVEVGAGGVELTWDVALEPPRERPSRGFGQGGDDDDRDGFDQF